jgi:hypothetical protein
MSENSQPADSSGFRIPPPADEAAPSDSVPEPKAETTVPGLDIDIAVTDTGPRDLVIGAGILAVLLVAFFFVRGAYANMLVRKRIAPVKANAAGWALFIFLFSISVSAVLAAIDPVSRASGPGVDIGIP